MAIQFQYAAQLRSQRIYRYRAISDANTEYVSRIFTHNELHFSPPIELNDPWECRPSLQVRIETDPAEKVRLVASALVMMKKGDPSLNESAAKRWLESLPIGRHMELAREITASYQDELVKDVHLCSFSATSMHPLLWSHYTNSHKGICLEFDVTKGAFGGALKVEYQDAYPTVDVFGDDADELLRATSLVKSSCWSYEEEYRLLTRASAPHAALKLEGKNYIFPPDALTGVILGCQINEKHKELVREWAMARKPAPRIFVAKRHPERFELTVSEL